MSDTIKEYPMLELANGLRSGDLAIYWLGFIPTLVEISTIQAYAELTFNVVAYEVGTGRLIQDWGYKFFSHAEVRENFRLIESKIKEINRKINDI